ncbi:unnamed protein product, partial [Choristocarpus tenellus]
CLKKENEDNPLWEEACDFTSRLYGRRWLVFDKETRQLREPDGTEKIDSQVRQRK